MNSLADLVAVFEQRLSCLLRGVTTEDDSVINGALESWPDGGTAIGLPARTRTPAAGP